MVVILKKCQLQKQECIEIVGNFPILIEINITELGIKIIFYEIFSR